MHNSRCASHCENSYIFFKNSVFSLLFFPSLLIIFPFCLYRFFILIAHSGSLFLHFFHRFFNVPSRSFLSFCVLSYCSCNCPESPVSSADGSSVSDAPSVSVSEASSVSVSDASFISSNFFSSFEQALIITKP